MAGPGFVFSLRSSLRFLFGAQHRIVQKKKKISLRMNVLYNLGLFQIFPGLIFRLQTWPVGSVWGFGFGLLVRFALVLIPEHEEKDFGFFGT